MFTCERCGGKFSNGTVAVVGMPQPKMCPRCRDEFWARQRDEETLRINRLCAIGMLLAAILMLACELWPAWKATDPLPPPGPSREAWPVPSGEPEDIPRLPAPTSRVMSADY